MSRNYDNDQWNLAACGILMGLATWLPGNRKLRCSPQAVVALPRKQKHKENDFQWHYNQHRCYDHIRKPCVPTTKQSEETELLKEVRHWVEVSIKWARRKVNQEAAASWC
jgi:hypothetical protein